MSANVLLSVFGVAKYGTKTTFSFYKQYKYKKLLRSESERNVFSRVAKNPNFYSLINYLFLHEVALSDGRVSKEESLFLKAEANLSTKDAVLMNYIIENQSLKESLMALLEHHPSLTTEENKKLIENLFLVSETDGEVSELELKTIARIKDKLGMEDLTYNNLRKASHRRVLDGNGSFYDSELEKRIDESFRK